MHIFFPILANLFKKLLFNFQFIFKLFSIILFAFSILLSKKGIWVMVWYNLLLFLGVLVPSSIHGTLPNNTLAI